MQQPELQGEQEADIIDLNAPASLGYISTPESVINSPRLPDDLEALEEVPIVQGLQAPPMNFSVEEVQQHELMFASESVGHENGQSSFGGSVADGTVQVGMALLPENLDMDPVLNLSKQRSVAKGCTSEGYRLWAKYFDSPRSSTFSPVPLPWKEFFIASLLNPSCFNWAKSFLSSDAWKIILSTNEQEYAISFVVPAKCPVKRKLECVCSENMQETSGGSVGWAGAHPEISGNTHFSTVACTVAILQCIAAYFFSLVAHPEYIL
jgi:hypothetical protein